VLATELFLDYMKFVILEGRDSNPKNDYD